MTRLAWLLGALWLAPACSLARAPIVEGDVGGLDAPTRDAPGTVCDPSACNDGNPCTDDGCGSAGCEHTPNGAACDDGLFCTTGERCAAGTCGSGTATCPSCDEAANSCGACDEDDDCPEDTESACVFDDLCDESGARESTSYACVGGTCIGTTETRDCPRATDGMSCGAPTVVRGPCEGTGRSCSSGGAVSVTTTTFRCGDGLCAASASVTTEVCVHDPIGDACISCSEGPCTVAMGGGGCTGTLERSCADGSCGGVGACSPAAEPVAETVACTAPAGSACTERTCAACVRGGSGPSATCTRMCSERTGTCAGTVCSGPMTNTTENCDPAACRP